MKQLGAIGLETQTFVFLFELGNAAACIHQARATTCPCRVHRRVNIQRKRIALGTPSGFHLNNGAIGHFDIDDVVIGMDVFFIV